jgi:putative tryptophan/tyrosine transport system substrate-binding protein
MKRREFITLVGGAAAAPFVLWPGAAAAQQRDRMRRIGVLMGRPASDPEGQRQAAALQRGFEELGWLPNRNIEIDTRWQTDDPNQRQAFAKELVELKPDILVANTTPALAAARQATTSIPMVFVAIADPVAQGFVQSLARPGGNITGFAAEEPSMGGKWMEMLREIAPGVRRITVIFNPSSAPYGPMFLPSMQAARPSSSPEISVSPVRSETDVESAIAAAARDPSGGLIFLPDSFLNARPDTIVSLVAGHRLPAIYPIPSYPRGGGLIAYGIERADIFHRAAAYVDRILRGEKPSDLPVQFPSKFELVINLKTAKALGLTVPPSLLASADEVIE